MPYSTLKELIRISGYTFRRFQFLNVAMILAAWCLFSVPDAKTATITVRTNILGPTPKLLAYNLGHFYTGGNTKDWWRYSGVTGARLFISPSSIEPNDDLAPVGDGVTNRNSFLARRAALRTDPLNTAYINWPYFTSHYQGNIGGIIPQYACAELRKLGVDICAQITASQSRLPIANANDWGGKWELWQHYYAQAFYLAREFDVHRFQMYNEPDHPNADGLTEEDFLQRLQLVADAVRCALNDVNRIHGKALTPFLIAPVTAGNSYGSWGATVTGNIHVNFLGQYNTNFMLVREYDRHEYNSTPTAFGSHQTSLRSALTAALAPEQPLPTAISEFNVHTAGTFDTLTDTLDTPVRFSRFGSIVINLARNFCDELYCFKFSQTLNDDTVKKNGMHYVDNTNAPYNIGTVTQAGEVWRLFNKAFAPGRMLMDFSADAAGQNLDVLAGYDPEARRYCVFSANNTTSASSLSLDFGAWKIPAGNAILVEEVSDVSRGGGVLNTNLAMGSVITSTQPANSVRLYTIAQMAESPVQAIPASDDAMVKDGGNRFLNYGLSSVCWVKNNSTNASARNATLLKFHLPTVNPLSLRSAWLSVHASTINGGSSAWALVYAITNNAWSQLMVNWSSAPNLAQSIPPGVDYTNNYLAGAGDSAFLQGQLFAGASSQERFVDVTEFVRQHASNDVSFLIARPVGYYGDAQDSDGISIVSTEGDPASGPKLLLISESGDSPFARGDAYAIAEDSLLSVPAPGVLANDRPGGGGGIAILVDPPVHGAISFNADGSFNYQPATNFAGADSFTYKLTNGMEASGLATVSISVIPVNDPPMAKDDTAVTLPGIAVAMDVCSNDEDVDGDPLAVMAFTQPSHGSVTRNDDGSLLYTPASGFVGGDAFQYTVSDGEGGTATGLASVSVQTDVPPQAVWTNLTVATEGVIQGGANAATDVDEGGAGYNLVKYYASPFDLARKAYFQFDLSGLQVAVNTQAVFTVSFTSSGRQRAQLWGLQQDYPGMSSHVTWNTAQANEKTSDNLLTSGPFTALRIGSDVVIPLSGAAPYSFTIPRIGDFITGSHVTLVMSGVDDSANDSAGGLRMQRLSSTLSVLAGIPPLTNYITQIVSTANGAAKITFAGTAGRVYVVQATTNLPGGAWISVATNIAGGDGVWNFIDPRTNNYPVRYYRAVAQ